MVNERNSSSSLRRALELVDLVAAHHADRGLTLTELAAAAGLVKSTTLRLLGPLLEFGYVESDAASGRYKLGAVLARLGTDYLEGLDLPGTAGEFLRSLSDETKLTVHLSVPNGVWMVYVDKVEAPQPVQMASRVGGRQPMYSTASGHAYIALAEHEVFDSVVAAGLARRTPNTPTTAEDLRDAVLLTRERGFGVDDAANEHHIRGVAAAVTDATGRPVAAISVVGPEFSVSVERLDTLGAQVMATARAVSARLGARPSVPRILERGLTQ
jgi:IclR family acetate operon transcriptional repressor